MGNCSSLKGTSGECPNSIRVLTDSGGVLQFKGPKLAAEILTEYPAHGIFKQGQSSLPLPHQETLISGQYYLLPLRAEQMQDMGVIGNLEAAEWMSENEEDEDVKRPSGAAAASDFVENLANGSALEALPWAGDGVWRVKLVIDTKQLEEILSEQGNTGALIETMRMVAATAGSAASTPRQTKSLWGGGGGWNWKPVFSNLFKVPTGNGMVIKHGY